MLTKKISNVRIAIMIAHESEDTEVIVPYDIWKRAGLIVELISIEKKNTIVLQSGTKVYANDTLERTNLDQFNAIYLPGGKGHVRFKDGVKCEKLIKSLQKFSHEKNKWLLAMCASPSVLSDLNLVTNQKMTCYPGFEASLGNSYEDKDVVVSHNFITGRSLAYAIDFSLTVIKELLGKEETELVKKEIIYK